MSDWNDEYPPMGFASFGGTTRHKKQKRMKCCKCGMKETETQKHLHFKIDKYICEECDDSEYNVRCPHCERWIAVN